MFPREAAHLQSLSYGIFPGSPGIARNEASGFLHFRARRITVTSLLRGGFPNREAGVEMMLNFITARTTQEVLPLVISFRLITGSSAFNNRKIQK